MFYRAQHYLLGIAHGVKPVEFSERAFLLYTDELPAEMP